VNAALEHMPHDKKLPMLPRGSGVITSSNGAPLLATSSVG